MVKDSTILDVTIKALTLVAFIVSFVFGINTCTRGETMEYSISRNGQFAPIHEIESSLNNCGKEIGKEIWVLRHSQNDYMMFLTVMARYIKDDEKEAIKNRIVSVVDACKNSAKIER